ncbi:MAG: hypothetical protein JWM14_1966 [Chitinophagaceae bacterium]|nr:hypothetical protein [Chitinophagaceae bacterium]
MRRTREDFIQRKKEVERYFDFLLKLDKDKPVLSFLDRDVPQKFKIDSELFKIIKANGFLLIYNLVESSCRNACIEILTAIQKKKLSYKKLSNESQKLWISYKVKGKNDYHSFTHDIIQNNFAEFQALFDNFLADNYDKDKDFLGISGNIDAKRIKELADQYGFSKEVGEAIRGEDTLQLIKHMRNKLAHGRLTFTESVKDRSVTDMIRYKDETVAYLESFLNNIENHIKTSSFKKPKSTSNT